MSDPPARGYTYSACKIATCLRQNRCSTGLDRDSRRYCGFVSFTATVPSRDHSLEVPEPFEIPEPPRSTMSKQPATFQERPVSSHAPSGRGTRHEPLVKFQGGLSKATRGAAAASRGKYYPPDSSVFALKRPLVPSVGQAGGERSPRRRLNQEFGCLSDAETDKGSVDNECEKPAAVANKNLVTFAKSSLWPTPDDPESPTGPDSDSPFRASRVGKDGARPPRNRSSPRLQEKRRSAAEAEAMLTGSRSTAFSPETSMETELLRACKESLAVSENMVQLLQTALADSNITNRELRDKIATLEQSVAAEKARECPHCILRGAYSNRQDTLSSTQDKVHGRLAIARRKRRMKMNDAIDRAQEDDEGVRLGTDYVICTTAVFGKTLPSSCAIPVVSQVQLRGPVGSLLQRKRTGIKQLFQHYWLPPLRYILPEHGTPVFHNAATEMWDVSELKGELLGKPTQERQLWDEDLVTMRSEVQRGAYGWSPKNPMFLAVRAIDEGGMIATPNVEVEPGDNVMTEWTESFVPSVMGQDPACARFTSQQVLEFSKHLCLKKETQAHVKTLHNKRLSDMKGALTQSYVSFLGFTSVQSFSSFFSARDGASEEDRMYVAETVGIGGSPRDRKFPRTHKDWLGCSTASFAKWRLLTETQHQKIQAMAAAHTSRCGTTAKGQTVEFEKLDVGGVDVLFQLPEVRYMFSTWMGRVVSEGKKRNQTPSSADTEAFSCPDDGGGRKEFGIHGDTSLITLARADAYMSAWLALTSCSGEVRSKASPSNYNFLTQSLLPEALSCLLAECRHVLEGSALGRRELSVPFREDLLLEACEKLRLDKSSVRSLAPESSEYQNLATALGSDSRTTFTASEHDMDFYLRDWRRCTVHFHDWEDQREYCVIRAEYFSDRICCWMGDVRDAFVGKIGAAELESTTFEPLTAADGAVAAKKYQETASFRGEDSTEGGLG